MEPNICLVVLDAVRASNLSGYGHDRPTSPTIDRLMESGAVFRRATAPTGVTIDSTTSLLSGRYPIEHQSGRARQMNASAPLLQELLRGAGYRTGAVTCNPFLSPAFGFDAGFDRLYPVTQRAPDGMNMRKFYDETKDWPAWRRYLEFGRRSITRRGIANFKNALQFKWGFFEDEDDGGRRATDWAREFIRAQDEDPFFLYVHYTETHMNSTGTYPYAVPAPDLLRFVDSDADLSRIETGSGEVDYDPETRAVHEGLYDAAIRYIDGLVSELVEALQAVGRWEETIFIITADHGELLGERDYLGHGELYEPVLHVPLVVKLPAGDERIGTSVDERVSTMALYETLLDEVDGVDVPGSAKGGHLFDDRPETVIAQDYSSTWEWSSYEGTADGVNALYHDERKLIVRGEQEELYDLRRDPEEQRNLAEFDSEVRDELVTRLDAVLGSLDPATWADGTHLDVDDSTRERLADLGYL